MTTSESLNEIGRRYGTDKGMRHTYLDVYEQLLAGRRCESTTLLEIGVLEGASLQMWREYLGGKIYGVDNDPRRRWEGNTEGCTVLFGDATNREFTESIAPDNFFDIIIDDGSHKEEDQLLSYCLLLPKLKRDGLYIVEDFQSEAAIRYFAALGAVIIDRRSVKSQPDDVLAILCR